MSERKTMGHTGLRDPRIVAALNAEYPEVVISRGGRKRMVYKVEHIKPGDVFIHKDAHGDGSYAYTCRGMHCRCVS